jgi:hypothetical protein
VTVNPRDHQSETVGSEQAQAVVTIELGCDPSLQRRSLGADLPEPGREDGDPLDPPIAALAHYLRDGDGWCADNASSGAWGRSAMLG